MEQSLDYRFKLQQFLMLLRKEFWEHQALFWGAPTVTALGLYVINLLVFQALDEEQITVAMDYVSRWFSGASTTESAPILSFLSLPFLLVLFFCAVLYLSNALYGDRRDNSILFWQSMPVSNLTTVMSKIVAIVVVMPGFMVAVMAVFYVLSLMTLSIGIAGYETGSIGGLWVASLYDLFIVYCYAATTALWLLPVVGWLLLFSAFARRAPLIWAIAAYFLLGLLESFVFGSNVLSDWSQTRIDPDNFLIIEWRGLLGRLFSYDMLIGLLAGATLIYGSVVMRRFID